MGDTIDHERARREAQRLVDEYPKLVQPNETTTNLGRAYLDLARKAVPREPTPEMFSAVSTWFHPDEATLIWQAMYDASQAPKP